MAISPPRATSPSIVPATIGRWIPGVTSLCPPIKATPSAWQLSITSWNSLSASAGVNHWGTSRVARNHRGTAPVQATSLAHTCAAYHPARSVAKVTGSLFATSSRSPPKSKTAASSPTRGPNTICGSFSASAAPSSLASSSGGNFPISIVRPSAKNREVIM